MQTDGIQLLDGRIISILQGDESSVKLGIADLINDFGATPIKEWAQNDRHGHSFLHLLAFKGMTEAIALLLHAGAGNINAQRGSDKNTATHLAVYQDKADLVERLRALGADFSIQNTYGERVDEMIEKKHKLKNIVWLDTELTNLPDAPNGGYAANTRLLEVAVIVTDRNLVELARGNWVIHHPDAEMAALGEWHQKNFADAPVGNGLFSAVRESVTTLAECEAELLTLIRAHCPKDGCPLAGSSVHHDREVLKHEMPAVVQHMSHQIVDVSSLVCLAQRWFPVRYARCPGQTGNHRAMSDIEGSLRLAQWFREDLFLPTDA